jgi:phospholipase/lecithinase/hemolysin
MFALINKARVISCLVSGMLMFSTTHSVAGFSSIYVFGDGVSNTNNAPTGTALNYYENRFCNGKVYVEVLSRWQGITFNNSKNVSNFGNDSTVLVNKVNTFTAPGDASTSLFIVWSNNADFVDFTSVGLTTPWTNTAPWTTMANTSIANQVTAITTLYNKGARKIVMPNAVDVLRTPYYNAFNSSDRSFARQRIIAYNQQFKTSMAQAMVGKPGLEIILPDTFAFFDQVLANPAAYGMINPSDLNAGGFDSGSSALNGAGAQYVFWDDYHPTAKMQMHLANFIQQAVTPIKVNSISRSGGNVQIQLANIPLERAGLIQGSATLQPPWSTDLAISEQFVSGGSTTKTYSFPAVGSKRFYRAAFPVVWTWP